MYAQCNLIGYWYLAYSSDFHHLKNKLLKELII